MDKKVIFSGIQPTGCITLGNYIGAIQNWLKLQDDYKCLYCIVDMHALTVHQQPAEFRQRAISFFAQYLATGLDPEKSTIYFQSHVPEHAQLTWVLNCNSYIGELSRMTQFKDKSRKHPDNLNMGLMDYPVLMAADILLYQTALVPVGIDQKQHVELARDIATRFNNKYSPTFTVPEPYIPKSGAKIYSLQDPTSKMSKSDEDTNAYIAIIDTAEDIARKFKRAVTDSDNEIRFDEVNKPGISNLLTIYSNVTDTTIEKAELEFEGKGYGEFKAAVGDAVIEKLRPVRERYTDLMNNKDYLMQIAKDGADEARYMARKTLSKVYRKIGFVEPKR